MNDFVIQFTITEKPYGEINIGQLKEMKTQTIMEPLVNSNLKKKLLLSIYSGQDIVLCAIIEMNDTS